MIRLKSEKERNLKLCPKLRLAKPEFGPIGKDIFKRSYSRTKPNGEKEEWEETCHRVANGNCGFVDSKFIEDGERESLLQLLYSMAIIPAGRHIRNTGVRDREFVHNCHTAGWIKDNPFEHYSFTMKGLMQGGGVGCNYSSKYTSLMPEIKSVPDVKFRCDIAHPDMSPKFNKDINGRDKTDEKPWSKGVSDFIDDYTEVFSNIQYGHVENSLTHEGHAQVSRDEIIIVEDNRDGWVDAIEKVFNMAWGNHCHSVTFDVSKIRGNGEPLESFGGTASGPVVLIELILDIISVFKSALKKTDGVGVRLTPIEQMQVDHSIAVCICAGGSRRSARMSMLHWKDPFIWEFMDIKSGSKKVGKPHWTTNLSIVIDDEFVEGLQNKDPYILSFHKAVARRMLVRGEPGYWNISNASRGKLEKMFATNPCVKGDSVVPTSRGLSLIKDMASDYSKDGHDETLGVFVDSRFGKGIASQEAVNIKKVKTSKVRKIVLESGHEVTLTEDHKVMTSKGWVKAKDLIVGPGFGPIVHLWQGGPVSDYEASYESKILAENDASYLLSCERSSEKDSATKVDSVLAGDRLYQKEFLKRFFSKMTRMVGSYGHECIRKHGYTCVMKKVQLMLQSFGVISSIEEDRKRAGRSYIYIAFKNTVIFKGNIGTYNDSIGNNIRDANYDFEHNSFSSAVVENTELEGEVDVYDLTQPATGSFVANGIVVSNCGEQGLPQFDACNLGHFNMLSMFKYPESNEATLRLLTRFLIRATYANMTSPLQDKIVKGSRRIGVGFLGFADYLAMSEIKYSESWKSEELREELKGWYKIVEDEANRYSFELRIPIPVDLTTVAPTGTTSFLPGVTPGCQSIKFKHFKRRVLYSRFDDIVKEKESEGYEVEDSYYAKNTVVVTYWLRDSLLGMMEEKGMDASILEEDSDISLSDMLSVQSMIQECWADNSVSFTTSLPEEVVLSESGEMVKDEDPDDPSTVGRYKTRCTMSEDELAEILARFLPHIKGTTVIREGSYVQMPYERCTKEKWIEMSKGKESTGNAEPVCVSGVCDL